MSRIECVKLLAGAGNNWAKARSLLVSVLYGLHIAWQKLPACLCSELKRKRTEYKGMESTVCS